MIKHSLKAALSVLLILAFTASLLMSGCGAKKAESLPYTITLQSEGGRPLSDVVISVYEDESLSKLVWASTTDKDGKITFTAPEGDYYATLKEAPKGYSTEKSYVINSDNMTISLAAALLSPESLDNTVFDLGCVFLDYEITDSEGNTHKISELLKTKKAVVLNFWFLNCDPCKAEFPYLQKAYEKYSEDVALIALNPVDGTDEKINDFAKKLSLTFPMGTAESTWESALKISAYPTTVVIDRYGTVALKHTGSITSEGEFEKIFGFFTSDSYKQTTIRNMEDIPEIN